LTGRGAPRSRHVGLATARQAPAVAGRPRCGAGRAAVRRAALRLLAAHTQMKRGIGACLSPSLSLSLSVLARRRSVAPLACSTGVVRWLEWHQGKNDVRNGWTDVGVASRAVLCSALLLVGGIDSMIDEFAEKRLTISSQGVGPQRYTANLEDGIRCLLLSIFRRRVRTSGASPSLT